MLTETLFIYLFENHYLVSSWNNFGEFIGYVKVRSRIVRLLCISQRGIVYAIVGCFHSNKHTCTAIKPYIGTILRLLQCKNAATYYKLLCECVCIKMRATYKRSCNNFLNHVAYFSFPVTTGQMPICSMLLNVKTQYKFFFSRFFVPFFFFFLWILLQFFSPFFLSFKHLFSCFQENHTYSSMLWIECGSKSTIQCFHIVWFRSLHWFCLRWSSERKRKREREISFLCFAIFYVVIDGLLRMNEMLIIAYELTQIPHTGKRIGLFGLLYFVEMCVFFIYSFVRSLILLTQIKKRTANTMNNVLERKREQKSVRVRKDLFSHIAL